MGNLSYIGAPSIIVNRKKIAVGNRVRVLPFGRLECGPFGALKIHDNVSIGPSVNITAFGETVIDENTTISANVFITDMDHDISDPDKSVMETPNIIGETYIGRNCFIGANCVILANVHLGKGCVVAANSTVKNSFPEYSIIAGSPARLVGRRKCAD